MSSVDIIDIAGRMVGPESPCFIVAEIAQAHDGSLGTAHAYIDAVAKAGADAVKFQTHIAEAESTKDEPFRVGGFPQDPSRYEYWRRIEFTLEQWEGLAKHAQETGLVFLSTPFSLEAVSLLERIGVPAWKIGSGDISTLPLIERVAATGSPVLLSSGMSTWSELDAAVECVRRHNSRAAVFQCTSSYPCGPEHVGLNVLKQLMDRYSLPTGLSDHSGDIFASLAAAALGAHLIEVHAVFSKDCFGPDVASSVTIDELAILVRGIRSIERMLRNPVDKDRAAVEHESMRVLFGRSLVAAHDLPAGHELRFEDFRFKKPATGITSSRATEFVGRVLRRPYLADEAFREEDFV